MSWKGYLELLIPRSFFEQMDQLSAASHLYRVVCKRTCESLSLQPLNRQICLQSVSMLLLAGLLMLTSATNTNFCH